MQNAIRFPVARRLAYYVIHPTGEANCRLGRHISNGANPRDFPPTHSFTRVGRLDLLRVALGLAGAAMVTQHECRMMDANGDSERPQVFTHFQGWKLQLRDVQREGSHGWRMRARFRPTARCAIPNYARSATGARLAMRKTTVRN